MNIDRNDSGDDQNDDDDTAQRNIARSHYRNITDVPTVDKK